MKPRDYDSTVARMAGNILAGLLSDPDNFDDLTESVAVAVKLARAIIVEVKRTEPPAVDG